LIVVPNRNVGQEQHIENIICSDSICELLDNLLDNLVLTKEKLGKSTGNLSLSHESGVSLSKGEK
jgi:hypothetical protein